MGRKPKNDVQAVTARDVTSKDIVKKDGTLDEEKIKGFLVSDYPSVRREVCRVLAEGLAAVKPVVCDGTLFPEIDYPTRLKYAETIAGILGESTRAKDDDGKQGDYHVHFHNVLQHIRQYEKAGSGRGKL